MASIRERRSEAGESAWAVLFRLDGKQRSKTFSSARKAEKFKALVDMFGGREALQMLDRGDSRDVLTVADLAEKFFDFKQRDVTARTLDDYRRDYRNYLLPAFGHRAAEDVDESDVQRWVDQMSKKLSAKSVADRHMLLHAMYKFGVARSRRLVTHNPCLETELPKAHLKPPKGTTIPEWHALMDAAPPDARDLILFLGTLGWRFSEAIALPVRDVLDDGEAVVVRMSRVFRMVENRQVIVEDAAKSAAGFRHNQVTDECAAMLRRRSIGKGPGDFVFTNSRGSHWNQNTWLRDAWPRIVKDANLGPGRNPTPHWLRHMSVYAMHASGASLAEIQRTIGHEKVDTTIGTYGRMIGGIQGETVRRLGDVLARPGARRHTTDDVVSGAVVEGLLEA